MIEDEAMEDVLGDLRVPLIVERNELDGSSEDAAMRVDLGGRRLHGLLLVDTELRDVAGQAERDTYAHRARVDLAEMAVRVAKAADRAVPIGVAILERYEEVACRDEGRGIRH